MVYSRVNFASSFTLRDTRGTALTVLNLHICQLQDPAVGPTLPIGQDVVWTAIKVWKLCHGCWPVSTKYVVGVNPGSLMSKFWTKKDLSQRSWFSRGSSLFQQKICVDSLLPNMKQCRPCHVCLI